MRHTTPQPVQGCPEPGVRRDSYCTGEGHPPPLVTGARPPPCVPVSIEPADRRRPRTGASGRRAQSSRWGTRPARASRTRMHPAGGRSSGGRTGRRTRAIPWWKAHARRSASAHSKGTRRPTDSESVWRRAAGALPHLPRIAGYGPGMFCLFRLTAPVYDGRAGVGRLRASTSRGEPRLREPSRHVVQTLDKLPVPGACPAEPVTDRRARAWPIRLPQWPVTEAGWRAEVGKAVLGGLPRLTLGLPGVRRGQVRRPSRSLCPALPSPPVAEQRTRRLLPGVHLHRRDHLEDARGLRHLPGHDGSAGHLLPGAHRPLRRAQGHQRGGRQPVDLDRGTQHRIPAV